MKWDEALKKDMVNLGDCKKYDKLDVSQRTCTSTDFCLDMPNKKWKMNKKSDEFLNPPAGQLKNMFYLEENSSNFALKVL